MRFHYGARGRGGNYSEPRARRVGGADPPLARAGPDVYAYFNNDWHGFAPANATLLLRRLPRRERVRPPGSPVFSGQPYIDSNRSS